MDSRNPFDRTIRRIRLLPNLAKQRGRCPLHRLSQRRHHAVQGKPANGGGTWIYLGTFGFNAGRNNECKVVLSNLSSKVGRIITADAVKIGGGMGNIARRISNEGATENLKSSDTATCKTPIQATSKTV